MKTPDELAQNLIQRLETERALGITELKDLSPKQEEIPSFPAEDKKQALELLEERFKDCRACGLSEKRTHVVFGSGSPQAKLLFVGEAPGYDEDQQGLPFVGKAGQLLTKIIGAMGLDRKEVYIANCLKCRPPENRNPLPTEISTCNPILQQQIDIIRPQIICTLGKFAAQTLLQTDQPISRLRGHFVDWKGFKVMPTFHPAYLLRNPAEKKLVWADVQLIMKELKIGA